MNNVSNLVGNTPIIQVPHHGNTLHLKIEGTNPGLSIKDRVAFHVCRQLAQNESLEGKSIVEYSSGNLAIGLAQAANIWKFHLTLVITQKTSPDKIRLLQRLGAELVMVDEAIDSEEPTGFRGFAKIISEVRDSIFIDQYNNPLNPDAHYESTGPEIHNAVPEAEFVFSPMGTGGTACGIAKYMRDKHPSTGVIGVSPNSGIYYTTYHGMNIGDRPSIEESTIEGVGEDLIPANLDMSLLSDVIEVCDCDARAEIENLLKETGIFVGGSSGMAIAAAKQLIQRENLKNSNLVVLCPDSGNRYLSGVQTNVEAIRDSQYAETVKQYQQGEYPKLI